MKEITAVFPEVQKDNPSQVPFQNKLAKQEKSFLSNTYTYDTNKKERQKEFSMEDAIRGFFPRSRSSPPRRSLKDVISLNRKPCHSTPLSATCKLPSLDGCPPPNRTCTMRPWSKTQDELRKFKQTLNGKK